MTDRVPVKVHCVESGPSLVAETLSRFLLSYHRPVTVCKILLFCEFQLS